MGPFPATCSCPFRLAGKPVHRASVRICLQEMTTRIQPTRGKSQTTLTLTVARGLRWVLIGTQRHIHRVILRRITREHPGIILGC